MVDKNLFVHDLAIVAILKNEGPYLKEWLDYHLLAGVDHFYLYDNESPDNQAEVAKPYVEAGLVDYFPLPGKAMQYIAYDDAVKRFKFQCRYMSFLDGDEFIYPKTDPTGGGIIKVVDEVFSHNPNGAGLEISWQIFGSNGQEKADYTRGVLERFTRRALNNENSSAFCKMIANARKINYFDSPHSARYFEGVYALRSDGSVQTTPAFIKPPLIDKIVINHYHCKSWEEYCTKKNRGDVAYLNLDKYTRELFESNDCNEEFDDGILKYRAERAKNFRPSDKSQADARLLNALVTNLSPTLIPTTPPQFYVGKMETFLTCRAVASYLQTRLTDDTPAKFFEEAALQAIMKSFNGMSFADARLLLRELPNLLSLPYPVVKDLSGAILQIIPQILNVMHINNMWRDYIELNYTYDLLKLGG